VLSLREYDIKIRETLEKVVSVEATSLEHAKHIAEKNWKNADYVLDADDFKSVSFHSANSRNRDNER
jgi:hypothetical protein